MLFLVLLKQIESGEAAVTISKVAFKRFLTIVYPEVCQQVSLFSKGLFTAFLRANEGPLSRMEPHVNLETASSRVSFIAAMDFTHEWFFPSVGQFVSLQVAFCNKLLVALNAYEWSLASMCPHVSLEVSGLCKLFQTLFKRANQYLFFIFGPLYFFEFFCINQFSVKNVTYKVVKIRSAKRSLVCRVCVKPRCIPC
jgi:hypothetical protein